MKNIIIKIVLVIILLILIFSFIYFFVLKKKINKEEIKYQLEEFKKSRALMGTLSIILALILCFVITPAFTTALKGRVSICEATRDIKVGEKITEQMIRNVEVGSYNLSSNIIQNKEELKNKYATTMILKGQYFYKNAVSDIIPFEDEYLYTNLTGLNRAMSFTVKNLSNGVSNKIISGDIISIIVIDTQNKIENEQVIIPEELKYVEVLSTTNNLGNDIENLDDKKTESELYQTITVLVSDEQAKQIAKAEATKQIYVELVYRGNKKVSTYLLEKQIEILNIMYPERKNDRTDKEIEKLLNETTKINIENNENKNIINVFETIISEKENNIEINESTEQSTETTEKIIKKTTTDTTISTTEATKSVEDLQKEELERLMNEYNIN